MPDPEHVAILEQGVEVWNAWRKENRYLRPNLSKADLRGRNLRDANFVDVNLVRANLSELDLRETDLRRALLGGAEMVEAKLRGANLRWANLQDTNLTGADLREACLYWALIERTNLNRAKLTGAYVYGTSVWKPKLEGAIQLDIVITYRRETKVTVDNLEVAQFIYLFLNKEMVGNFIDTVTSKVVLLLGRFSEERKAVLDALRKELRVCDYVPVIFDFEKPVDKSIADTVLTLAKLARFVIADVTDAKWVNVEAQLIVRNSRSVPFRLIKHASASVPSPINDLRPDAPQLIEPFDYESRDHAAASVRAIIEPAERMAETIRAKRKAIEDDPW